MPPLQSWSMPLRHLWKHYRSLRGVWINSSYTIIHALRDVSVTDLIPSIAPSFLPIAICAACLEVACFGCATVANP